jgi:hypothetical protein
MDALSVALVPCRKGIRFFSGQKSGKRAYRGINDDPVARISKLPPNGG